MPKQVKVDTVNSVKEKLSQAKSVVITDYRGLTVSEMTDLRNRLRKESIEYRIIKNRLVKIALRDSNLDTMDHCLKGMTAIAFGMKDPVAPAKVLSAYAKDNEKLKLTGGLMDGAVLDLNDLKALANVPSREVLLGRMLGSLSSPVQKLAYGLNATVAQIAYVLDAVARKKGEQA